MAPEEPAVESATSQLAAAQISGGGLKGKVVWEYEAAEDNELTLREGAIITSIEQLDEGWWSGVDADGREGLFPASYVELIDGDAVEDEAPAPPAAPPAPPAPPAAVEQDDEIPPPPPPPPPPAPPVAAAVQQEEEEIPAAAVGAGAAERGLVCTALYDFDASEDNELTFSEGDAIIHVDDQISEDWWSGTSERTGAQGLFPANYVERA